MDLTGQVAIVTGGNSGIGAGIVRQFAALGAKVVIAARDVARSEALAAELRAGGAEVLVCKVDVTNADQVAQMISATLERFGGRDVLVNCAGTGTLSTVVDMIEEEWDMVMDTNLKGTFLCSQAVARWMIEAGKKGRIINISSINDKVPLAGEAHYCASKAGVLMFSKALALELAPYGINVNAVSPAGIETPLMEEALALPELRTALLKQIPRGRFGQPADVSKVVAFLASEWAEWVTGDTIYVDGGMHLVGEESYVYAFERAMGHDDRIPRMAFCWPPGALEEKE